MKARVTRKMTKNWDQVLRSHFLLFRKRIVAALKEEEGEEEGDEEEEEGEASGVGQMAERRRRSDWKLQRNHKTKERTK